MQGLCLRKNLRFLSLVTHQDLRRQTAENFANDCSGPSERMIAQACARRPLKF
jgi:hypothetical protein